MSTSQTEAKTGFIDRLSTFLQKFRIVFLVLLIAVISASIGYFIWKEWQQRAREKSSLWSERAQELYQKWSTEQDLDKKQPTEKELADLMQNILRKYPRENAAQRAYFLTAEMAYRNKDWQKAAASYETLSRKFPRSYLASLSLMSAGACYEELGDGKKAITAYERLTERYRDSFLVPHALLSIGRLKESEGDYTGAVEAYNRLEDDYPLSNWTKAGRNRIIDLKIKGKISE